MSDTMSNRLKLTNMLMTAWSAGYIVTIVPTMTQVNVILDIGDRCIIEHLVMDVPSEKAYIVALVEGLEKAFKEADRE